MGFQSRFAASRCYKGETLVNAMVQTKQGASLHQAMALCGASLLKGMRLPQLYLQETP